MIGIGNKAPDFQLPDKNGNIVKLSLFKGKKVILYFYPKDDTPGCTSEACNFRDNYQFLQEKGFVIIGISADTQESHKNFAQKHQLPFILLSDFDKKVINKYGAWGTKNLYGRKMEGIIRKTFIINEKGYIEHIIEKVDTKNATVQILNLYT